MSGKLQQTTELPEERYQQVDEIIMKQNEYLKFKRQIERMQQIMRETNDTSHPNLLNLNINEEYTPTKLDEIKRQLTCSERTKYGLYSLDNNYCLFLASQYYETIDDFTNLEISTTRAMNNLSKFHYNPIALTQQTLPLFSNLQTLYLYSENDNQFTEDEKIKQRKEIKMMEVLFLDEMRQLEEWTNRKCKEVVFDTDHDDWSLNTSVFNTKLQKRGQLVFVVEDTENNKFGYYLATNIETNTLF